MTESSKEKKITIILEPKIHDKLKKDSSALGLSMSAYLRMLIMRADELKKA